jgi:TPR repeat protein
MLVVCAISVGVTLTVLALFKTPLLERIRPGSVQSMNKRFLLNQADVAVLSQKAEAGDGDAAMKVFEYYNFGRNDYAKAYPFLKLAYAAGHPRARSFMEGHRRRHPEDTVN